MTLDLNESVTERVEADQIRLWRRTTFEGDRNMREILTATHASDEGHWYHADGTPAYTMIGKNGKERPTTLRDARKENLKPSVTSILKLADRPGLNEWKIDQAILSALTCPRIDDESETAYLSRIKKDAQEQAKKAAERGTVIHAWVQEGFEGKIHTAEQITFYEKAKAIVDAECGVMEWICEKSFATDTYGGKCDLHNDHYLLDIKTTEKDLEKLSTWPDQHMQLAAYNHGLNWSAPIHHRKCGILYINVKTAESKIKFVTEDELRKGFNMFGPW